MDLLSNSDKQSISKKLDKVLKFYIYKKKDWRLLQKNSFAQIKKNFSISNMANGYFRNWMS